MYSVTDSKGKTGCYTARVVVLAGNISEDDFKRIKKYYINPVECRETAYEQCQIQKLRGSLREVTILNGFNSLTAQELKSLLDQLGLAMSEED